MQKLALLSISSVAALAVACGGPARPKLKEIETTDQSGDSQSVYRWSLEYSDDRLVTASYLEHGEAAVDLDFEYQDDRVDRIARSIRGEEESWVLTIDYEEDDRVSSHTRTWAAGNIVTEFDYDGDDRIERVSWTETYSPGDLSFTESGYTEFEYDDDGRLEHMQTYDDGAGDTVVLDYDDDGMLDEILLIDGSSTDSYSFSYNDDNKVDRVSLVRPSSVTRYALEYNDDNRVKSTDVTDSDDDRITTRYSYGDGDITQLVPTPDIPWGGLFDLQGERLEHVQALPWNLIFDD
jgi:hypothetical protein